MDEVVFLPGIRALSPIFGPSIDSVPILKPYDNQFNPNQPTSACGMLWLLIVVCERLYVCSVTRLA